MLSLNGGTETGTVKVVATSGHGLSADQITDMAINKILFVADTAPLPIREQAAAFKGRIESVIRHYVGIAQRSARTTLIGQLRQAGHHAAADMMEQN